MQTPQDEPRLTKLELWHGCVAQINMAELRTLAIPVKGISHKDPLRFLELFANDGPCNPDPTLGGLLPASLTRTQIERLFFPTIPGVSVTLGEDQWQPPFVWRDASPRHICVSFTYNTNALYRILTLLRDTGRVPSVDVDSHLDDACRLLAHLYRACDAFLLRNINNNFNMYLISKVVEFLLGKDCYNAELQELPTTQRSLDEALILAQDHALLSIQEKMALAVGAGVTFIESRLSESSGGLSRAQAQEVQEIAHRSYGRPLAIDHRQELLDLIADGSTSPRGFHLAVILDDATETVDDLLWLQDSLELFPHLHVHLLVNTAQISINFSTHMLAQVLSSPVFLRIKQGMEGRFVVVRMYCPFISFQTNFLPPEARSVIDAADAVYIKGANFFETCQIPEKHSFHGFVVFGKVSRTYTGLQNFDSVFAHLPPGTVGYVHSPNEEAIVSLARITNSIVRQ